KFIGISGGGDSVAINMAGASDQTIIEGNYFYGDWSDYVIKNGAASISMVIKDNIINNLDAAAGGKLMTFHANSYGSIVNNKCYGAGSSFTLVGDKMFVSPDNVFMTTENVETRNYETMIGEFTGATGSAQGTSIYSDIVLAKADLVSIITLATLADANTSFVGMLGYNDNNNAYSSASVAANEHGSILERLEQLDVDTSAIVTDTSTGVALATDVITAAVIEADAITSAEIANNAIGPTEVATDTIDADALAQDALDEIQAEVEDAIEADDLDHL
ncbi:unnamed protein product, partial [marine sediment metagenome]